MAVNRFGGSFKVRTDILDNITPNVVVQPNVSVPAGEWKPVPWLPVEWQGEASKDGFVISAGKVVSLTTDGYIIPSGFRALALRNAIAATGTVLAYTATDVELRVQDVTTGEPVTEAKTVSATELVEALMSRGIIAEGDFMAAGDTYAPATDAHVHAGMAHYVSPPVGVCAYDVYTWGGTAEGGDQAFANYSKQHLVQFLTDVQLQVPIHCKVDANGVNETLTSNLENAGSWTAEGNDGYSFPDADSANAANNNGLFLSTADLSATTRYAGLANVGTLVGYALQSSAQNQATGLRCAGIAANTDRTPVSFNAAGDLIFLRERSTAEKCTRVGDWFWDYEAKVILLNAAADTQVANGETITYSVTGDVETTDAAANHRYVHAQGALKPGQFVTYDQRANFVPVDMASAGVPAFSAWRGGDDDDAAAADFVLGNQACEVVGRCLAVIKQPRGLLDRVRTAWEGSSFAKDAQMPGSATKGFTDLITLSDETVANEVAIINIKCQ